MVARQKGVDALTIQVADLKEQVASLAKAVERLAEKQDISARPNWAAIAVAVSVVGLVGAILYWPIREQFGDIKIAAARTEAIAQENNAKIQKLEEQARNLDRRYDAVSNRLAEFIRTKK